MQICGRLMQARPTAVLLGILACAQAAAAEEIAFVNVNVVPMDRERVLEGRTVLVADGRIAAIGPATSLPLPPDVRRIEASGRYLIPGLADMHIHLWDESANRRMMSLYVVNGVTTVLNLDGRPEHLRLRRQIESGALLAPRLYSSGPTQNDASLTPRQAVQAVARQHAAGYDCVKVYNKLPAEAYRALIGEARRLDLPVIGHAVRAMGIDGVLESGQHIAHMEEFVYGHFTRELGKNHPDGDAREVRRRLEELLDPSGIPDLARRTARAGIHVIPNLIAYRKILLQVEDLDQVLSRPEVRYVSEHMLRNWRESNPYTGRPHLDLFLIRLRMTYPFLGRITKAFQEAGVPLMLGTDAPLSGVVPGFSAHDDLREMVQAGLSPYQALQAATRVPAEFLGRRSQAGTVEVGKWADLVLLAANPLQDIAATRRIEGVLLRGRWLPKADLENILHGLARSE